MAFRGRSTLCPVSWRQC